MNPNQASHQVTMFVKVNWILIFLIPLAKLISPCPLNCLCKWKNGKQTVECLNKEFLIIPEGMSTATQVLEFSGNNLQILHEQKFLKLDLVNLQRIYLARCKISYIESRPFMGLSNLVELDLGSNLIENVPTESFLDCPSLMKLTLSNNPIKALGKATFNHLSFLTTLELNNCEIGEVDKNAFLGLMALEWLNMQGNKMKSLDGAQSLPSTLKGVQLQDNPWHCDCHMISFHEWLIGFSYPLSFEPICMGPNKLKDKSVRSIQLLDLACLPDVTPTTFFLEIEEGKNISLQCHVSAIPEAKINWIYQGQLIQNDSMVEPGIHLVFFIEQGTLDKKSELFIYNANTDDNGTFICSAENPAGISQANYTIRVVVKKDPVIETQEVPFEFIVVVISTAGVSVVLLIIVLIISIIKCQKNSRMKRKRENSKAAVRNNTKDNLLQDSTDDSEHHKDNSTIKVSNQHEEMMLYNVHCVDEDIGDMAPNQMQHVNAMTCCPEQNPDIINGTEYISQHELIEKNLLLSKKCPLPTINEYKTTDSNAFVLPTDVHLNPIGLIQPVDVRSHKFTGNCYKTLPHNRVNKRPLSAAPIGRYSHEAEFMSINAQCAFEQFDNIRYTADGYPVRTIENYVYSPVGSHKSVSSNSNSEPCCSSNVQWPACMPANPSKDKSVIRKSVGAQTQTECLTSNLSDSFVSDNKDVDVAIDDCVDGDRL